MQGTILKFLSDLRSGAGIAEKFPLPFTETVYRIGSPNVTLSVAVEVSKLNEPIAPLKEAGRSSVGIFLTFILIMSEMTDKDSSLPKPKKGH